MEYENKFASRGVGGAGLGLGIAGTALGVLNGGLSNILGGGNCNCNEDHLVNRYELGLQQEIAAKDTRIGLLESNIYTDSKLASLYEAMRAENNSRFERIECQLADQRVFNATNTATLNCISGQVASLLALTKTVIPNTSVCPGWGNVTVAPATTTTA